MKRRDRGTGKPAESTPHRAMFRGVGSGGCLFVFKSLWIEFYELMFPLMEHTIGIFLLLLNFKLLNFQCAQLLV